MDLSQDLQSMYIYCDLVELQAVVDIHTPLLRTVPLKRMLDTPDAMNKVAITHISCQCTGIYTIEIDIRDDVVRPVPYMSDSNASLLEEVVY